MKWPIPPAASSIPFWLRGSPRRAPIRLRIWWKSPATGHPSCSVTLSLAPWNSAPASPNPANSPCAPTSTAASTSHKPKPFATSSTPPLSIRPASPPARHKVPSPLRLAPLKASLLELISLLEAGIDFAEDDISVAPAAEILRRLDPCISTASALARSFAWGKIVRSGFSLALVGLPNAGKSSLFNRLLEQDRAIVTPIPGTTRDTVSESADFSGIPVRLVDTAGIRESSEVIEQLGIARSRQAMSDADLTVVVVDASCPASS